MICFGEMMLIRRKCVIGGIFVRYGRNIVPTFTFIVLAMILVGNALCFAMHAATVNQERKKKMKRRMTLNMMMYRQWLTVVVRAYAQAWKSFGGRSYCCH
jgi:hypothetical protein